MERKEFLERVRTSLRTADLPAAGPNPPGALLGDRQIHDLRARFVERATEASASVSVTGSGQAVSEIVKIMRGYETDQYLAWADSQMPVPGVGAGLISHGFSPRPSEVPTLDRIRHQSGYFDLLVGITGADGGLAESGSIVLTHGVNRSRMASLIPDAHVALLPASSIVPSLSHWAADRPESLTRSVNLVVITGPSRTGDIEMHLTQGVHGPRYVHILVLEDR